KINFFWQKVNTNAYSAKVNTPITIADRYSKVCFGSESSPRIEDPGGIIDFASYSGANALMLKKIEYSGGAIELTYKSLQDPFLEAISVKNSNSEEVKSISLTYGSESGGNHLLLQSL